MGVIGKFDDLEPTGKLFNQPNQYHDPYLHRTKEDDRKAGRVRKGNKHAPY